MKWSFMNVLLCCGVCRFVPSSPCGGWTHCWLKMFRWACVMLQAWCTGTDEACGRLRGMSDTQSLA